MIVRSQASLGFPAERDFQQESKKKLRSLVGASLMSRDMDGLRNSSIDLFCEKFIIAVSRSRKTKHFRITHPPVLDFQ